MGAPVKYVTTTQRQCRPTVHGMARLRAPTRATATVTHAETTKASPATVWTLYSDVDQWRRWDGGVTTVTLHGPFATGTRGNVTLPNGRRGRLRLLDVREGAAFTDVVRLPFLTVRTRHNLDATHDGTTITHTVTLSGGLARLFPRLMTIPVRSALPASVAQLAFLAAHDPVSRPPT